MISVSVSTKNFKLSVLTNNDIEEICECLDQMTAGSGIYFADGDELRPFSTSDDYVFTEKGNFWHLTGAAGFKGVEWNAVDLIPVFKPKPVYENYLTEIIRFDYNGGSAKGIRVIKVEDYCNGKLTGRDLVKGEQRTYCVSKIVGEIEQLT